MKTLTEEQLEIAKKILNTLQSQRFSDWYNGGRFEEYLSRCGPEDELITKEEICGDIVKLFKI
jgi:hypothetical protein